MYKYEKSVLNLPKGIKVSRAPVVTSKEETEIEHWKVKMIDYLGIDILTFDGSQKVTKYDRYCDKALYYLNKGQDVPDEIKEYLLKEKEKRGLKKNKDD